MHAPIRLIRHIKDEGLCALHNAFIEELVRQGADPKTLASFEEIVRELAERDIVPMD